MKLLFVASEVYPLVKTGGLGDVAYSLPVALHGADVDVRLLLPGYRELLRKLSSVRILGWLELQGAGQMHTVRILQSHHPDYPFPLWIVDCPAVFDRPGTVRPGAVCVCRADSSTKCNKDELGMGG